MVKNNILGHDIFFDPKADVWKYCDNEAPILTEDRSCIRCGCMPTKDGHDYCLRNLGSVTNACCGHGVQEGYIQFEDGTLIQGYFKVTRNPKYGEIIEE